MLLTAGILTTAFGQTFNQDLDTAWKTYQAANYAETAKQLESFRSRYAQDPAFISVAGRVDYILALCLVQLQRWKDLPPIVDEYEKSKDKTASPAWSEELAFWKGRALMSSEQPGEARKAFEDFLKRYPTSKRAQTVWTLLAMSAVQAGQWADAAELLAKLRPNARGVDWGRYLLLETLARTNAGQTDRALDLIDEGHRNWRRLGQITAFELLAVQLSEKLMAEPDKSRAIRSLIRIQPRDKILELQDQQIENLQKYADTLKRMDPKGVETAMATGLIDQVKKERAQFAAVPNFDSSVRFRVAKAFLDSQRYRETAYVLDTMLDQLPPDAIVEQGADTLAKCYTQIQRWDKVVETVDKFVQKFPSGKAMPAMLLQKGLALQNLNKIDDSNRALDDFLKRFPKDPLAPNAAFLKGFNSILTERYSHAAKQFKDVLEKYPNATTVIPTALFWEAQGHSMAQQSDLALPLYDEYIAKYPNGESAAEARYRRAFSLYDLRDYNKAVPELEKFIEQNPDDPNSAEAMLLLGDAYFGRHEYDKAVAILMRVPMGVGSYRQEAFFKIGKYYKLAEEPDKLRALFQQFQEEFPESARLSEAVYEVGMSYAGDPAKQREIFLEALDRFGNEPAQWGVTDILQALVKSANTPEARKELISRLRSKVTQASNDHKRVLQLNSEWGIAATERVGDPAAADRTLIGASSIVNAEEDNPTILIDIAQALQRAGKLDDAVKIYRETRRWNPMSPFNQAIFANLGLIALQQGKPEEAGRYFDRYFNETPATDMRGTVMLKAAGIERAAGKLDRALELYEQALADKGVERVQKAAALLVIGEIYIERKQPDKAIPYLQRIYVLYTAFPDVVAKAYLLSGQAFESRNDNLAAARTYVEMLNLPDFTNEKFAGDLGQARKRLEALPADVRTKAETLEKEKRSAAAVPAKGA